MQIIYIYKFVFWYSIRYNMNLLIRLFILLACVLLHFYTKNNGVLHLLKYFICKKQTFFVKFCIFFGYNMIKIIQFHCVIVNKIVKTITIQ